MKRFLFSAFLAISQFAFSQQLISFEASEGYTLGNIYNQQGWITTSNGATPPVYISNQVVTNELSTGGTNSLKLVKETAFGNQSSPVMGGFLTLPTAPSATNFTLSFDVRITDQSADSSDFLFRGVTVGTTSTIAYYITFRFNGAISVANIVPPATTPTVVATTATWVPNTWYRVKIVGTATNLLYYINNTLVYTATQLSTTPGNINRIDFVHDNYLGSAYIDRIAINNEASLSANDSMSVIKNMLSISPNPTSDILNIKTDSKINAVSVVDMTGRKVDVKLNDTQVDVRSLPAGTYLINIETKDGISTEKFIKK
ncbi:MULTISPECIES: T9SS type A sorting domain-containing protein [Chryseobacterium]|uniref:Por secretion system C-terminal sorting domain n=1 Tax=Chryseobacterium taihuense TaxID=1141221 RepID=A0A4U8WD64_9FLAO|nr:MULTISPECIES: T9SS type A sorting domain-containing protein [Chryseobacterium]QQV03830.1 T9SS type A sorting domain-containing protein [Chryseobacterium sp. FDAARGOS 1104]VFB02825.1 Por secretion system C-terminal sorting domain [Chryseobacterium taihuense]